MSSVSEREAYSFFCETLLFLYFFPMYLLISLPSQTKSNPISQTNSHFSQLWDLLWELTFH